MNAEVFGVSPDSAKSHRKFRQKLSLPYRLLVDDDHRLADAYGIWQQKKTFGVTHMGVVRTTIVIDGEGRVARIFPKVQIDGHVEAVAAAVKELDLG
jgi:peroxiredoxin Q/BCP